MSKPATATSAGYEIQELPVSPAAQDILHAVNVARWNSELKAIGGRALFGEVRAGRITASESLIISQEIKTARTLLTMSGDVEPPVGPPEVVSTEAEWTPTAILDTLPPASSREYDWAERAAGEYLDDK